jgi:hypothetical protein
MAPDMIKLAAADVTGVTVTDLVSLIPVLAAAYAVILGTAALATGWQIFRDRPPPRYRRGGRVSSQDGTGHRPGSTR